MIDRYTLPSISELSSRLAFANRYLGVLTTVAAAQGHDETVRKLATLEPDVSAWEAYEQIHRHETAGFIEWVRDSVGTPHRDHVYIGLTSSDLQDTAEAMYWKEVWTQVLEPLIEQLRTRYLHRITDEPQSVRVGRTHGRSTQLAVPVNELYGRATRNLLETGDRLRGVALRANLSGPVGSFSSFLSYYDATVVARGLGLELDNFSTQTADRHAMAEIAMQLVQLVGIAEQVATTQRLASISGVDEFVEDHLDNHQIGSSSMPHKVNPIKSEQVCGLARVARGHLTAILETAHTQWWERDLTNSSVERLAWRDLIGLTAYILNVMLHAPMTWKPKRPGNFEESTFYQYNQAIQTGCHSRDAYRGLK